MIYLWKCCADLLNIKFATNEIDLYCSRKGLDLSGPNPLVRTSSHAEGNIPGLESNIDLNTTVRQQQQQPPLRQIPTRALLPASIQQAMNKIDRFLGNQMLQNSKTNEEIQTIRTAECAGIQIRGGITKMVTIIELESRFQQQQEATTRVTVPSTDILEWKSIFPLIETCSHELDRMKNEFDDIFTKGADKIKEKETLIDEELDSMTAGQTKRETANKIALLVMDAVIVDDPSVSPNSPVKMKLNRRSVEWL
jgi:hypothetical protein